MDATTANTSLAGDVELVRLQQQLMSYARDLSATVKNLQEVHDKLEEAYLATLSALAAAIEARDPYLVGHSRSVSAYAQAVGLEMGLLPTQLETLRYASLLHDIGKIGVPDSALKKSGPLDDLEWQRIREHPEKGYRMLSSLGFLGNALMGILHHHERYDGLGYPRGLAREDIPLIARILSACDALDAMTSNRSYRQAMDLHLAVSELVKGRGTQFDPLVIDVLVGVLDSYPRIGSVSPSRADRIATV